MERSGEPLVLLQTSDWHVGSALTGKGLGTSPDFRKVRKEEVDGAAERAVAAAQQAGADLLVVPGDLWDAENASPAVIHRLLEALASFAPRPVFVAPGNHDFAGAGGYYDAALLLSLGMRSWPDNVLVFRSEAWETVPVPGRSDATVTGRATLSPAVAERRPLADPPAAAPVPFAVLMIHGSLESYAGPDAPSGAKRTSPFSADELAAAGFRWAALGHHHRAQIVASGAGEPIGAYSGSPTGRGLDETGPRFFLKVTLPVEGPALVEKLPADSRVVHDLAVDVTGLEGAGLREKVARVLAEEGVGPLDVVRITLAGDQPLGARPALQLEPLPVRPAHLVVRDRTTPAAADPDPRTAEGRFLMDMAERLGRAATPEERRLVEAALALGRDALAGRSLAPPPLEEF